MSGCRPEGLQGEEARSAPLAMGPAGVCSGWLLDWQDVAKADDGQRAGPRPRCRACYLRGMGSWPGMLLQRRPCRFDEKAVNFMVKPSCLITGDDALLCALDRLFDRARSS